MPKPKVSRLERNKFIAWMATNRSRIENKTLADVESLASAELAGDMPTGKMIRTTARDLGITLKASVRRSTTGGSRRTDSGYVKVRTLARIVLKLCRELGAEVDEDLLIIAGRAPVNGRWNGEDSPEDFE